MPIQLTYQAIADAMRVEAQTMLVEVVNLRAALRIAEEEIAKKDAEIEALKKEVETLKTKPGDE